MEEKVSMAREYRKAIGSAVWHFFPKCSTWPTSNYIESQSPQPPEDGELCTERTALQMLGKQDEEGVFSMDKDYRAHDIHATASYVPRWLEASLYVVYGEGGRNIIKNFTIDQFFPTREEAEQAARHLQKNG